MPTETTQPRPALVISGRLLGAKVLPIPTVSRQGPGRLYQVVDGDMRGRRVWMLERRVVAIKEAKRDDTRYLQ